MRIFHAKSGNRMKIDRIISLESQSTCDKRLGDIFESNYLEYRHVITFFYLFLSPNLSVASPPGDLNFSWINSIMNTIFRHVFVAEYVRNFSTKTDSHNLIFMCDSERESRPHGKLKPVHQLRNNITFDVKLWYVRQSILLYFEICFHVMNCLCSHCRQTYTSERMINQCRSM